MPDPKQEIAVEGPLLERLKLRALMLLVRLLRLPYRLLTLPLKELRAEVASLRAAAVESLAYVGVELRRLGDLVEQSGTKAAPTPEETALAGLEVHGPVLVVGRRGQKAADALAAAGYDVTQVDGLEDLEAEGPHFGAVLYMSEPSEANGADLQRIGDLLSQEGALLVARRTSSR